MKRKTVILELICTLFITLFLYTAVSKWVDFSTFKHQMFNQPIGKKYLPVLLYVLPSVEILCSLCLIWDKTRLAGLIGSVFLMISFTGYIVLIKLKYWSYIPCSCGGIISSLTWTQHLFLNSFFILIGSLGIYYYLLERKSRYGLPNITSHPVIES